MKRLTQLLPIFLAAALQIMPLVRNLFINPAAGNTIAFILRWGVGSTAAFGAYDAFSAATTPYFMPLQTNIALTVGIFYTNNIIVTNTGTDSGGYFELTNKAGLDSGQIGGGSTTTVCLPAGLTLKCYDTAKNHKIYAAIYGTPTATTATTRVNVDAGQSSNGDIYTNLYFTVTAGSSPPVITNQPVSLTNNVGSNVTFSVTAGTAPLNYQWYFNTNTALFNATNATLTLTSIQLTNDGYYRCTITNTAGLTNTIDARLTVWQPPVITNPPVSVTNLAGSSPAFSVTAGGVPAIAYQWKFNTNTVLAGATGASLTLTNARASQAGTYCVIVSNSAGSVTNFASLVITNPPPAAFAPTTPVMGGGNFQFTFTPVIGLTNTILTNGLLVGGTWNVFTNVPPPATAAPIVISAPPSGVGSLFYRVQIIP